MPERVLRMIALGALAAALGAVGCGGGATLSPLDLTGLGDADASSEVQAEDLAPEVVSMPPLVVTPGDALRPKQRGDRLAFLSIDEGSTGCLTQPWLEECLPRIRVLELPDGAGLYSSTDVYSNAVPLFDNGVLLWTGADNRLRAHALGDMGVVKPLENHADFYGIQGPVLVRDGKVYWYTYNYTQGTNAIHQYSLATGAVAQIVAAQHDWPWFLSDLGALNQPQFDLDDEHVVWIHYQPTRDTWYYQILLSRRGDEGGPETLDTGDVNCIWPRLRGDWVYYLWFSEEYWECSQLACTFHLSRINVDTGEVEAIEDDEARLTGLYPPLLWDGGAGWIDFRDGAYRVVLRPDGGDPVAVTPPERPVGLYGGVDLVPLDDGEGSLRVLWSTLYDDRLQIFAEDWTP